MDLVDVGDAAVEVPVGASKGVTAASGAPVGFGAGFAEATPVPTLVDLIEVPCFDRMLNLSFLRNFSRKPSEPSLISAVP